MKPRRLLVAVFVPVAIGVAAAAWTSLSLWYEMKEGLIAFLGFLAAALVQVIPVTANFLQADKLSVLDAQRITESLKKQQYYWIGLLAATIAAMIVVIVGAVLKDRVGALPILFRHHLFVEVSWGSVVCFFIASSIAFVFVKMFGLFEGVLALQGLRTELVINNAKRDAAEKTAAIQREVDLANPIVPEDYGRIIRPH